MVKEIVKEIMGVFDYNILEWQALIQTRHNGESISTCTISCWKRGEREMKKHYKNIFIKLLCENEELRKSENAIRARLMKYLNIGQYQKLYWEIQSMQYPEFLSYMLNEIRNDSVWKIEYVWNRVSLSTLRKMCVQKSEVLYSNLQFSIKEEDEKLVLVYVHEEKEQYDVSVDFLLGDMTNEEIETKCVSISEEDSGSLLRYLFTTQDISDELYLKMMEEYKIYPLKIDFYDIESIKVLEAYVVNNLFCPDEETLRFMNVLADVVLHKLCEMNHIVLKEILCYKYDYSKVNEKFFSSNLGIWQYQYPVRRALAYEESIIKQKLRLAAKKGQQRLEILDINIAGGLMGLRYSFGVESVTCVDISYGEIQAKRKIVDKYNQVKSNENGGINNVKYGYLRLDTMNLIGIEIPAEGYDLINLGVGSGSYIADLDTFLRQLSGWLKTDRKNREMEGIILLSVFNKEALCFTESQAKMDFKYEHRSFRHIGDEWSLPVNLYTQGEICHIATKYYELLEKYSYPTILSVVSENYHEEVLEKLKKIDKEYSYGENNAADKGLFHILYLKKMYFDTTSQSHFLIKQYINEHEIVIQTIQHKKITSKANMIRELNQHNILAGDNFVKTIVLYDEKYDMLIYFLLPLNKKFKKEILELWYFNKGLILTRRKLRFYRETELLNMGVTSGSVSPFFYSVIPNICDKYLLCDIEIQNTKFKTLYTYSGELDITYRIEKNSFLKYLKENDATFI